MKITVEGLLRGSDELNRKRAVIERAIAFILSRLENLGGLEGFDDILDPQKPNVRTACIAEDGVHRWVLERGPNRLSVKLWVIGDGHDPVFTSKQPTQLSVEDVELVHSYLESLLQGLMKRWPKFARDLAFYAAAAKGVRN